MTTNLSSTTTRPVRLHAMEPDAPPFDDVPPADESGQVAAVAAVAQAVVRQQAAAPVDMKAAMADIAALAGTTKKIRPAVKPAFTAEQRRILDAEMPLSAYRLGEAGPFVPAAVIDETAKLVFGESMNTKIVSCDCVFAGETWKLRRDRVTEASTFRVVGKAVVEVSVQDAHGRIITHAGAGVSLYDFNPQDNPQRMWNVAVKGAVTDARRNALSFFGRIFSRPDREDDRLVESLRDRESEISRARNAAAGSGAKQEGHPLAQAFHAVKSGPAAASGIRPASSGSAAGEAEDLRHVLDDAAGNKTLHADPLDWVSSYLVGFKAAPNPRAKTRYRYANYKAYEAIRTSPARSDSLDEFVEMIDALHVENDKVVDGRKPAAKPLSPVLAKALGMEDLISDGFIPDGFASDSPDSTDSTDSPEIQGSFESSAAKSASGPAAAAPTAARAQEWIDDGIPEVFRAPRAPRVVEVAKAVVLPRKADVPVSEAGLSASGVVEAHAAVEVPVAAVSGDGALVVPAAEAEAQDAPLAFLAKFEGLVGRMDASVAEEVMEGVRAALAGAKTAAAVDRIESALSSKVRLLPAKKIMEWATALSARRAALGLLRVE